MSDAPGFNSVTFAYSFFYWRPGCLDPIDAVFLLLGSEWRK
jgi:hypothetical protein